MPLRLGWTASIGSQDVRAKREAALNRRAPRFRFPIEIRPSGGRVRACPMIRRSRNVGKPLRLWLSSMGHTSLRYGRGCVPAAAGTSPPARVAKAHRRRHSAGV